MQQNLKTYYLPIVVLGLFIMFSGCQKDIEDPGTLVDVPPTFNVRMIEHLDSTSRFLTFEVNSIEFQECLNGTIDFNLSQNYNSVLLSLNEIIEPEVCQEGNGPAQVTIPLAQLETGFFQIEINLKNTVENMGELSNRADHYLLEMQTNNGIQLLNPELLKVPENVIWGTFSFREESQSSISQAFFDELELLASPNSFPTGDYGHFYVVSDQSIFVPDQSPEDLGLRRNFLYNFDGDIEALKNLLESYRNNYELDIHILMKDNFGRSW